MSSIAHPIIDRVPFPRSSKVPVSEVTTADLVELLTPLWHRNVATAKRVRQRLRAVLERAVAMEYRLDNPCDRIGPVLGSQKDVTEHMQAVPHREAAAVIRRVRASAAVLAARLAFEFLVLTTARWGEVRWAEWEENDRDGRVWTVPARRTKTNRRHRVPLCGRALELLEEAKALDEGAGPLVFTHGGGKQMHDSTVRRLLRQLGIAAVPHGFRSSFRDWAAEETDHPREVIEAALAHVVRNRVEAAVLVYIDPGMGTRTELNSWRVAHRPLWQSLLECGWRTEAVAVAWEQELPDRAERVMRSWVGRDLTEAGRELLILRSAVSSADWETVER